MPAWLWSQMRVGSQGCGCEQQGCRVSVMLLEMVLLAIRVGREADYQLLRKWCRAVPCRAKVITTREARSPS